METQVITPEENSNLTTSIGDWDTNGEWIPITPYFSLPAIEFDLPIAAEDGYMTLVYPHFNPNPGSLHNLLFEAERTSGGDSIIIEWLITDGNYSFTGEKECGLEGYHDHFDENIQIPNDWDQTHSTITITLHKPTLADVTWAITQIFCTYEITHVHIDNLPLMGIG